MGFAISRTYCKGIRILLTITIWYTTGQEHLSLSNWCGVGEMVDVIYQVGTKSS